MPMIRRSLVTAVALSTLAGGATAQVASAPPDLAPQLLATSRGESLRDVYFVAFDEAPLASYRGEISGFRSPPRVADQDGHRRLDVHAADSTAYVNHLRELQASRENAISVLLHRPLQVTKRFQHALNATVIKMTPEEAARVAQLDGVRFVRPSRLLKLHTDAGPELIGAPRVWQFSDAAAPETVFTSGFESDETASPVGAGSMGEGTVVGIIDSGINYDSPAFAAVDGTGYAHANPLGDGDYLGLCAAGGTDEGKCNSKLIGAYDFVYSVVCAPADPGTDPCRDGGDTREEPGAVDTNGHGTHTAGTTAGNRHHISYGGLDLMISGVAPRANIIAYDVCYSDLNDGGGYCPDVSTAAAVDQAIADGVVDAINYSIGGGADPWTDPVSLAFLSAEEAGIFVSASAGNSGELGAGTVEHNEPWVTTVAASTHGRASYGFVLNVTGPGTPSGDVTGISVVPGSDGVTFAAGLSPDTPLVVSPGIDATDDGCASYPASTFDGAIAVVRRGSCNFSTKANNATAAGAIAVVIGNNAAGGLAPVVTGTTVPVFGASQADADALRDWSTANTSGVTAEIPYPAQLFPGQADVIAYFSSRGPSAYPLVKPDVAAPGVNILAPYMGEADSIDFLSGTSMAAPHNAGAGALLRDINPTWSPMQIKSALAMTATAAMTKEDKVTAADAWDMGAGRLRVDLAAQAGLLLDENGLNFLAADPSASGDPKTLNLPSMADDRCIDACSFERTFQNPRDSSGSWTVTIEGLAGTVAPSAMNVVAGGKRKVQVTVDSSGLASDDSWHFGSLVLTPGEGNTSPELRLPIAVRVPAPALELSSDEIAVTVATGATGSVDVDLRNIGGPTLEFDATAAGTGEFRLYDQTDTSSATAFFSTFYDNFGTGYYSGDDFTLTDTTTLRSLVADGVWNSDTAPDLTSSVTWAIFADNAGAPDGDPDGLGNAPVWTYTAALGTAGLSNDKGKLVLDAVAAGENITLPAGTYWLTVFPNFATYSSAKIWYWWSSTVGSPDNAMQSGFGDGWLPVDSGGVPQGLSMLLTKQVACGSSWLASVTPASGSVGGNGQQTLQINIDASALAAGSYVGYACVSTNDAGAPVAPVQIDLTVTP